MSRAGRKRKHMERRERNGDVQRAPAKERLGDVVEIAVKQPHRKGAADPRDPRLEHELGRMLIRGEIEPRQYAAGRRWAGIVARMRQAIDAPSDRARGLLGGMVGGSAGPARDMTPEEADEARAAYADADHAIGHAFRPQRAHSVRKALKMAIIFDQRCSGTIDLLQGLNVLAAHFDL